MKIQSLALGSSYMAPSAWWQHVPVAHWIVNEMKPQSIVELGTHYGVSLFAFCEAAAVSSPGTFVYAVDTWEGDLHSGHYSEDVYGKVASHLANCHRARARLVRSTFDEAATHFGPNSVDLLHIDGLHTYEAAKHDFETWLPMLKEDSIVLFHDTNVRERDFGVWRLWQELKDHPGFSSIEILNGHGLGVLARGSQCRDLLEEMAAILPLLISKGELLEKLAELTPGGSFVKSALEVQVEQAGAEAEQARVKAEEARARAEEARAEAEEARAEAEEARAEAEEARAEAEQATELLSEIINSESWKATLPIRNALNMFKCNRKS